MVDGEVPVTTSQNEADKAQQPANSAYLLTDPRLKEVLLSDVGVESLLSRLKQSVVTCKEFALYIKRTAAVEAEHSASQKKTARLMTDAFKRPEMKKGTFQTQILNIIKATDRVGDAGNTFLDSMHRIHDELNELVKSIDRQRKTTKETALRHEKNLLDAEHNAEKSKSKYDSICEELDRVRTGDPSKKLGFKPKSEEDLHRRMTVAEVDYQQKVDTVQRMRRELTEKLRVESVRTLQNLILECDQALSLQVLRYTSLCETLQLNRGFVISPIKPKNSPTANLSVKEMACKIDSELDYYNHVWGIPKQKPQLNRPLVEFRKHPTLGGSVTNTSSKANKTISSPAPVTKLDLPKPDQRDRQSSGSSVPSPSLMVSSGTAKTGPVLQSHGASASSRKPSGTQNQSPVVPSPMPDEDDDSEEEKKSDVEMYDPSKHGLAVFGVPLDELLDYEEGTVPRIVYQCVQAIDNFGLEVEGIYRTNGNSLQVQEIRREFDINASAVDLLRPNESVNDIHSVASALKQYFQALPDPLLTKDFHREFINAANIKDDIRRRDTIHLIINKLPDPNYTTLRYLVFHLYRVQERDSVNRMTVSNLGIVWGPTLMDTDYTNVGEMAVQSRVIETILINAYAIFEAE